MVFVVLFGLLPFFLLCVPFAIAVLLQFAGLPFASYPVFFSFAPANVFWPAFCECVCVFSALSSVFSLSCRLIVQSAAFG